MNMDIFENPLVQQMNERLSKISPSLKISKVSHCEDKIMSVGVLFPLKGNANLMKSLKKLGFEETFKEKSNGAFMQRMEFYIHYDKYAIYQGDVGKYAMLYIDNVHDFKRHGLFGSPYDVEFPIVVNSRGGRHTFRKEYEEGFLKIKEVGENEEPLTREEMFPKNSDSFLYGWIDREGNTYACSFEGHFRAAEALCQEKGIKCYNDERALEEAGWIKISRKAPYTPDNVGSRCIYFNLWECRATQAQIDKLYDLGLEDDMCFKHMLQEMDDNYER